MTFHRRTNQDGGFTLIEVVIAMMVLVVVVAASGPLFFGAMHLTNVTNQRSQATNLAVQATEQMRAIPYSEVGFAATPAGCAGASPVVLSSTGPLDGLPSSTVEGTTTYTIQRCIYWSASSIVGSSQSYKQTLVTVSWTTTGGTVSVTQASALYPGTQPPPTTTPPTSVPVPVTPTCTATDDGTRQTTAIDVAWTLPAGGTQPSSYTIDYSTYAPAGNISASSNPYSTTQIGSSPWVATVGPGATYYFQVIADFSNGTQSSPSAVCSASTTSSASSGASATSLLLSLAGGSVSYSASSPSTTATNDGTKSNAPNTYQPTISIPGADSFLSVTAATQIAEANQNGSSYACSGLLSNGASLSGGSSSAPCSVSGSGSGGVSLNLAGLPGVSTALTGVVGSLSLNLSGATSWASGGVGATPLSGSASLAGASCSVSTLGGLASATLPLSLPATITSSTNVMAACTTAIGASTNPLIKALAGPLQTALGVSVLNLTADYQTVSGGDITVSALHISVLNGTGTADLAISTAGVSTATPVACLVSSLVVTPSKGTNGGGVALTSSGLLVNENAFQLAVAASTGCTDLQVAYAPTDCVPGASGCTTYYATLSGTGGTYYGTAGTATTAWNVGTTTFTVYVGSPAVAYSPLTQQQVILCTEKGNSGKC